MFSSLNFFLPFSFVSWHSVRRMQCMLPYWSMIWLRNWRIGRWVFTNGVRGFVLPYVWLSPIMAMFIAPQMLPVLAIPPPKAVTVFGVTFIL